MAGYSTDKERMQVGLPSLVFTFTLDQLSAMLSIEVSQIKVRHLYYAGRSIGRQSPDQIYVFNVAFEESDKPEWRVSHKEFMRWCKRKGARFYDFSRP